jgi:hypothetical protein
MLILDLHDGDEAVERLKEKPVRLTPARILRTDFPELKPRAPRVHISKLISEVSLNLDFILQASSTAAAAANGANERGRFG